MRNQLKSAARIAATTLAVLLLGAAFAAAQTCYRNGTCTAVLQFEVEPADGVVWIGNDKYKTHRIETPPLSKGSYSYEATVKWIRDGKVIEQKVKAGFSPGELVKVPVRMPTGEIFEGVVQQKDGPNFGLQVDRIPPTSGPEAFSVNGVEVGRPKAEQALAAGALPDDRKNLRFTVIGPKEFTAKVIKDLADQGDLKDKLAVQSYTEAAWAANEAGFKGGTQIYLQQPDGKVLWRQENYDGGPAPLFEAVRKKEAEYRAELDPGPGRGASIPPELILILILAAAAAFVLPASAS